MELLSILNLLEFHFFSEFMFSDVKLRIKVFDVFKFNITLIFGNKGFKKTRNLKHDFELAKYETYFTTRLGVKGGGGGA